MDFHRVVISLVLRLRVKQRDIWLFPVAQYEFFFFSNDSLIFLISSLRGAKCFFQRYSKQSQSLKRASLICSCRMLIFSKQCIIPRQSPSWRRGSPNFHPNCPPPARVRSPRSIFELNVFGDCSRRLMSRRWAYMIYKNLSPMSAPIL